MKDSTNWAIVGGGIMGMTLAHRLSAQGHNVTIYEASEKLGGLVSSWKMGSVEWDKFYHVILLSDFYTRGILSEIGLEQKLKWVETKTGFYIDGKLYSMSDTIEFLRFPTLNLWDKFRLGLTILIASKIKNWKKLEKISVTDWLRKWSGKNTFQKIWLPLLRAKLGESYKETSAVFIWATIQRMYGARKSGLKKEMFGYVEGGYKTVIESFTQSLLDGQVNIRTNSPVNNVQSLPGNRVRVTTANETSDFDEVIVTLPSDISARICTGLTNQEKEKLEKIEYLSVICIAVLLNKPISHFYVTNITDSRIPFTGVIEMTALVDKASLDGKSLVYLPKYVVQNDPLFNQTDEFLKEYFIENLKKMYPTLGDESIEFVGVAKAKHVITVAKLNYSEHLPSIFTSDPNIHIINTSHIKDGTLNVNETIRVAETKLEELLSAKNANQTKNSSKITKSIPTL